MEAEPFVSGHEALNRRINVRREIRRIRRDPMLKLAELLQGPTLQIDSTDVSRYKEAYWFYFLAMQRAVENVSLTARFQRGPRWKLRSRQRASLTAGETRLIARYREMRPFLEFDLVNTVLHARILLDRAIALSRSFVKINPSPSFTSFHDHKKFFLKNPSIPRPLADYAEHLRTKTNWFDTAIKTVRDKYIVHAGPSHMRFTGLPNDHEVELIFMLPNWEEPGRRYAKVRTIRFNVLRMSYDIEIFLAWLDSYWRRVANGA